MKRRAESTGDAPDHPGGASGPVAMAGDWRRLKRVRLPLHRNPGLEIVSVIGGGTRWHVAGRVEPAPAGSLFFTFPWELHGGLGPAEPGLELQYVVIRLARDEPAPTPRLSFHPALRMHGGEARTIGRLLLTAPRRAAPASRQAAWLVRTIVEEYRAGGLARDAKLGGLCAALLVELARSVAALPTARPDDSSEDAAGDGRDRVERFLAQLQTRCDEPWTLAAMASACGLARTRFGELVRHITGETPIMALNRRRIERAKELLLEREARVTRVAMACGFSSSQHFSRTFQEYVGVSPTRFRSLGGEAR